MARKKRHLRLRMVGGGAVLMALWIWIGGPGTPVETRANTDPERERPVVEPQAQGEEQPRDSAATATVQPQPTIAADEELVAAIQTDHVEALLHRAEVAMAEHRYGTAWTALESAETFVLPAELQRRCDARRAKLDLAVQSGIAALVGNVIQGRVLAARDRLRQLLGPSQSHPRIEKAVDAAFAARGWPRGPQSGSPPVTLEAPMPLRSGRSVRLRLGDKWTSGRVVGLQRAAAAGGDELTIEVQTGRGLSYPFVQRHAVEPIAATTDEAAAQAAVALRAGDWSLGVLWLGYCHQRGGAEHHAVRRLTESLRQH